MEQNQEQIKTHEHNGIDSKRIWGGDLRYAPLDSIDEPSGGTTVDSQARVAISNIISTLQALGLIK